MDHSRRSSIITGFILVLLGAFFLAVQSMPDFADKAWPLIVIGVGVALFLGGLFTGVPAMAIPACIVSGIGALLFWQNATDRWESWSYAWALIPGFVGVGRMLASILGGQSWNEAFTKGSPLLTTSAVLFIVFWSFLGEPRMEPYWPILLIIAGLALIVWPIFKSKPTQ